MNKEECKMQYLEFIQNVITRMNTNSFQIKELTILIVTACLAIYASDSKILMLLVPIFPTSVLWCLDSYYLLQERKFRSLYDDVANVKIPPIYNPKVYAMPMDKYTAVQKPSLSFWRVLFSKTILSFYISLIATLFVLFWVLKK